VKPDSLSFLINNSDCKEQPKKTKDFKDLYVSQALEKQLLSLRQLTRPWALAFT
jgi:hypothetical protein